MYSVRWLPRAEVDAIRILDILECESRQAAISLADEIEAVAKKLELFPALYRRGAAAGTREAIVKRKYLLTYRIVGNMVEILAFELCRRRR